MLAALQLPYEADAAADACLSARGPADSAGSIRARARWSAALAAELRDCSSAISAIASSTEWEGAAALACHDRLIHTAPNFSATAQRGSDYAVALLGYASGLDGLAPRLVTAKGQIRAAKESLDTAELHASGLLRRPVAVGPVAPGFGPTILPNPGGDPAVQRAQQEVMARCREFAAVYNEWVGLVQRCAAGLAAADGADPTRDLHGWRWVGAHVSAVEHWSTHWSWAKVSATLNVVSSVLAVVAVCLLPVAFPIAGALFVIAAGLSFAQCLVDLERKEVQHDNSVSWGGIAVDFIGALPLAGVGTELKLASRGVAGAVRSSSGSAASIRAGATELGAHGRRVMANFVDSPIGLWTGDQTMARDSFRSLKHGGVSGLARRWAWPLGYIVPDSVLGFPGVPGPPSEEQGAWAAGKNLQRIVAKHSGSGDRPVAHTMRGGAAGHTATAHGRTASGKYRGPK